MQMVLHVHLLQACMQHCMHVWVHVCSQLCVHILVCTSSQGFVQAVRAVYVLHTHMCRFDCVRTQSVDCRHTCSWHSVHVCVCWGACVCPTSSWYMQSACGAACAPGVLELRRCWQCPESCAWAAQASEVGVPPLTPLLCF